MGEVPAGEEAPGALGRVRSKATSHLVGSLAVQPDGVGHHPSGKGPFASQKGKGNQARVVQRLRGRVDAAGDLRGEAPGEVSGLFGVSRQVAAYGRCAESPQVSPEGRGSTQEQGAGNVPEMGGEDQDPFGGGEREVMNKPLDSPKGFLGFLFPSTPHFGDEDGGMGKQTSPSPHEDHLPGSVRSLSRGTLNAPPGGGIYRRIIASPKEKKR